MSGGGLQSDIDPVHGRKIEVPADHHLSSGAYSVLGRHCKSVLAVLISGVISIVGSDEELSRAL